MNGENLSLLDPDNRPVYAKTQLDRWSRPRNRPIGCRSLGGHSLGRRGEHRAGEYHPGPARKLLPLRAENALSDDLIRLLRGRKARQKGECNDQHVS
jgi:hypothetical protein